LDLETGLFYNRYRYYAPYMGRYVTQDPIGLVGGFNKSVYVSDPVQWTDPLGLSGTLTILSSGNGGSSMASGHAWIAFKPDGGVTTTYGTWGNNPTGKGNGLFTNLEAGRGADASRSMHINDAQEKELLKKIDDYKKMGKDGWKLGAPCSSFARDTWKAGTGEDLNSNYGPISNPTTLKESIVKANGGLPNATATAPNGGVSASFGSIGRSFGSSINSSGSSF